MHRLRERWEDLLQAADDHNESATFERLSNIMEYTEDVVNDTWLDAKSFMSRQSSSSIPEALRPLRDYFRDILDDEPVLLMSNPRTRDESDEDSQDNASAVAALLEHGRSIREESTRDRSTDSSESSAGNTARPGRPRTQGLARPRSYILRDEVYIGPTDLRNMRQDDMNHACQECKDGSRCWCPIREELPDNNGRTSRSRQLRKCRSCQKTFVIVRN